MQWYVVELYNRVFRGLAVFIFETLCVCVWKLEILQNTGLKLAWNLHHYLAMQMQSRELCRQQSKQQTKIWLCQYVPILNI